MAVEVGHDVTVTHSITLARCDQLYMQHLHAQSYRNKTLHYLIQVSWQRYEYVVYHQLIINPLFRANMRVIPYQVRKADNWMYLVVDDATNEAAVVDPWDHEQITQKVKEEGVKVRDFLASSLML